MEEFAGELLRIMLHIEKVKARYCRAFILGAAVSKPPVFSRSINFSKVPKLWKS